MNLEAAESQGALTIAEEIASYLLRCSVIITPIIIDEEESDSYYFYSRIDDNFEIQQIGVLHFNKKTGKFLPDKTKIKGSQMDKAELKKQLLEPFKQLLLSTKGNFYAKEFDRVHDALDAIEEQEIGGSLGVF